MSVCDSKVPKNAIEENRSILFSEKNENLI